MWFSVCVVCVFVVKVPCFGWIAIEKSEGLNFLFSWWFLYLTLINKLEEYGAWCWWMHCIFVLLCCLISVCCVCVEWGFCLYGKTREDLSSYCNFSCFLLINCKIWFLCVFVPLVWGFYQKLKILKLLNQLNMCLFDFSE